MPSPARAEHIGSLKRPEALLRKRSDFKASRCTAAELRAVEDECIADAVKMQLDLGVGRRDGWRVSSGIVLRGSLREAGWHERDAEATRALLSDVYFCKTLPSTLICVDKIRRVTALYAEDFDSVKSILGPKDVARLKVTMCAPEWLHFRHGPHTYESSAYTNDAEYFTDLARVYREEIGDLYRRGCRRIQIDDPVISCFCDATSRERMTQAGMDPGGLLNVYFALYKECLRNKPDDMLIGLHICRGNIKPDGTLFTHGGYDWIAERLFTGLDFDCLYLEYDSESAGGFEPLRYFPRNKRLVLGLVSTKTRELEDPATLRERIMRAADAIAHGEDSRQ